MSNFSTSTGAPVIRVVDGKTYEFPKLKKKQVGKLFNKWAEEDFAELKKTLDDANIPPVDRLNALIQFKQVAGGVFWGAGRLIFINRCEEVFKESMGSTWDGFDELPFTNPEFSDVALEILGSVPSLVTKTDEQIAKEKISDPLAGKP